MSSLPHLLCSLSQSCQGCWIILLMRVYFRRLIKSVLELVSPLSSQSNLLRQRNLLRQVWTLPYHHLASIDCWIVNHHRKDFQLVLIKEYLCLQKCHLMQLGTFLALTSSLKSHLFSPQQEFMIESSQMVLRIGVLMWVTMMIRTEIHLLVSLH